MLTDRGKVSEDLHPHVCTKYLPLMLMVRAFRAVSVVPFSAIIVQRRHWWSSLMSDNYSFSPGSRVIWDAVSQHDPLPLPPKKMGFGPDAVERPDFSADTMLNNMRQSLEQARRQIVSCFHESRPRLSRMKHNGTRLDPGGPNHPLKEREPITVKIPNGPPVVSVLFICSNSGSLTWTTAISTDNITASALSESEWQEACDVRLTFGLAAHFDAIESDLARLDELPDDKDGYWPDALTWRSLVDDNPSFLYANGTGQRYADFYTHWKPSQR